MRFVFGGKPELDATIARWVCDRVPDLELSGKYAAIGLMDDEGAILAGVVYDMYRGYDIQMHVAAVAGKHWLTKTFLEEAFKYPFEQLGVSRITGLVSAKNETAQDFDEHLGFRLEGRIRHGMKNGDDLLIYGMLRSECRWLKGLH